MERNSNAPLSPKELASLRGLRANSKRPVSSGHRQVLLSMGLVIATADELNISLAGRVRLNMEDKPSEFSPVSTADQKPLHR